MEIKLPAIYSQIPLYSLLIMFLFLSCRLFLEVTLKNIDKRAKFEHNVLSLYFHGILGVIDG